MAWIEESPSTSSESPLPIMLSPASHCSLLPIFKYLFLIYLRKGYMCSVKPNRPGKELINTAKASAFLAVKIK